MNKDVAEISQAYQVAATEQGVPAGYKQTEVGVIPDDWQSCLASDVIDFYAGYSFSSRSSQNSGVKWLKIANVGLNEVKWDAESYLPKTFSKDFENYLLKPGDVVMALTRPLLGNNLKVAKLTINDSPALLNQRVAKLNTLHDNNANFMYYIVQRLDFIAAMNLAMAGSDPPNIGTKALGSIYVPVPPAKEQIAIANALSDVDALLSELEKLIAKKQAIKTATMQQLLTGRTRLPQFAQHQDGSPKGYKQSELGEIPEGWDVVELGSLLSYEQPTKYLVATSEYLELGTTPVLTAGKSFILGYTAETHGLFTNLPAIIFDDFTTDSKYVDFNFKAKSSAMKMLKSKDSSTPLKLIFHILNNVDFQVGDHKRHWISEFSKLKVMWPTDPEEQTSMAAVLADLDDEVKALKQRLNKTRQIKQGMMQELLTGKTRLINNREVRL